MKMAITYAWSEPSGHPQRPVRGFIIGSGSTAADLPTQRTAKPVVDVMVASGVVDMYAGTGSIATDRGSKNLRLESDGQWWPYGG
jgi:hypothetical protein